MGWINWSPIKGIILLPKSECHFVPPAHHGCPKPSGNPPIGCSRPEVFGTLELNAKCNVYGICMFPFSCLSSVSQSDLQN